MGVHIAVCLVLVFRFYSCECLVGCSDGATAMAAMPLPLLLLGAGGGRETYGAMA
jgi:hypothetical protein